MPRRARTATKPEKVQTWDRNKQLKAMSSLLGRPGFAPAREVLTSIQAVPTIFPQYDLATKIGGHPLQRVVTVHGPSNHGKTAFVLGLGKSFLQRGHFFYYVDAEHTMDFGWPKKLFGECSELPGFVAQHPASYEECVDSVRSHCEGVEKSKRLGELAPDTSSLIVIDSIKKLVPQNFLEKIKKGAENVGVDGYGGRGAQMKAALNAAWLDELTPLLFRTGTTLIFITRESVDVDADANARKWGNDYKVTGGGSLIYDAALRLRIELLGPIYGSAGSDEKKPVYGERHRIAIHKTKVAGKTERVPMARFYTSNGNLVPYGFDTARDFFEMALQGGLVKQAGAWFQFGKHRWNGENQAVKALTAKPEVLRDLEERVREKFTEMAVEEAVDEGDDA